MPLSGMKMVTMKVKQFVCGLSGLGRSDLITLLRAMQCGFDLDFTDEFLQGLSTDELRHVVSAASHHAHNLPDLAMRAAS